MLYEDMVVYCADKENPLYGKRLKVDVISEDGRPYFTEVQTGNSVEVDPLKISTRPLVVE